MEALQARLSQIEEEKAALEKTVESFQLQHASDRQTIAHLRRQLDHIAAVASGAAATTPAETNSLITPHRDDLSAVAEGVVPKRPRGRPRKVDKKTSTSFPEPSVKERQPRREAILAPRQNNEDVGGIKHGTVPSDQTGDDFLGRTAAAALALLGETTPSPQIKRRRGRPRKGEAVHTKNKPSINRVGKRTSGRKTTTAQQDVSEDDQEQDDDIDMEDDGIDHGADYAFLMSRGIIVRGRYTTKDGKTREVAMSRLPKTVLAKLVEVVRHCDGTKPGWQNSQDELDQCVRLQTTTRSNKFPTSIFEGDSVAHRTCTNDGMPCFYREAESNAFVLRPILSAYRDESPEKEGFWLYKGRNPTDRAQW